MSTVLCDLISHDRWRPRSSANRIQRHRRRTNTTTLLLLLCRRRRWRRWHHLNRSPCRCPCLTTLHRHRHHRLNRIPIRVDHEHDLLDLLWASWRGRLLRRLRRPSE
jgi:hypothetical protein